MRTSKHSRLFILAFVCFGLAYVLALCGAIHIPLGAPGSRDFVQYWGAWELLRRGLNPYDGHLMHEMQVALSGGGPDITMMWNPPWTPVLLSPLLALPFEQAAALWFFTQLCIALALTVLIPNAVGRNIPVLVSAGLVLFFLPVLDGLYWGQLSLLLTLAATMFVYFEKTGKLVAAGVSLLPLTLKPHLLLFVVPAGVLWWWRLSGVHRWRFLGGFLGAFLFLCAITLTLAPNALVWWVAAVFSPSSSAGQVPTVAWKTATVTTWIRIVVSEYSAGAPVWPMFWLPLGTLTGVVAYYSWYKPMVTWRTTLPALVGISLVVGSYGWLYDQSILLIGLIAVAGDSLRYKDRRDKVVLLTGVFGTEFLAMLQSCLGFNQQHFYVWVPVMVLCLLGFNGRCLKRALAF